MTHWKMEWRSLLGSAETAAYLEMPCVCACQPYQSKLCRSVAPRVWPLILQSKAWNSLREWMRDDRQGLKLGLKLELHSLTNWLKRFFLLRSPRIICVDFEFFSGLLNTQKLRTAVSQYQPSFTRLSRIYEQTKPLLLVGIQLVGQAAEVKFESKFEPLQIIWQSLQKTIPWDNWRFNCKINGWAVGAAL